MTIEVRQMLIRSMVAETAEQESPSSQPSVDIERVREQILAECKARLLEWLREQRER